VRAQPVYGRFLPPLTGDFVRFCCVGGLGFVVDFSILTTLVMGFGVNKIVARCMSFSVAVVATWLANRMWTFRAQSVVSQSLLKEFGGYLAVQSIGFAANFAVYLAVVTSVPIKNERLMLFVGSVAGTAAGLLINYLGAKHLVFRRRADPV
jgi:putative flippase GtrA